LNLYGEYLKDIRNHEHLGNTFIERGYNTGNAKKSIDEHGKTSDALFSKDTTVIHISGNKESIGKILKTSQGLSTVFGYSKTEVIGHSINILMPTIFAKKHTEFMERFFRTGRQAIFYSERTLFATHRSGYCFQMKLVVKQMPSLAEGI
jgi:PAS domain S-box-containing protein